MALVFDVGETLIDETRIWSRWADRLGVSRFSFMGVLGGMAALDRSHMHAFEILCPGIDVWAEVDSWRAEEPDGLRENFDADDLYPDVRAALAGLRQAGYQVVIAGNQPVQAYDALVAMDLPAARAGMRTALIRRGPWGYLHAERPEAAACDLVIDGLHDLLPALPRL